MKTCIHTVILNEPDEYLKSWLDYHTSMVDHIFIYEDYGSHSHKHLTDKYSNVTLASVLDLFDDKDEIIERKKNDKSCQSLYIKNGVLYIQSLSKYDWCLTLDIDEFITLQEPYNDVYTVLSEFIEYDAVVLHWLNYGASGRVFKPDYGDKDYRLFYPLTGEQSNEDKLVAKFTKIAWNLNRITEKNIFGCHIPLGKRAQTNFENQIRIPCYDKMYLAHYITRSWEEYLWKLFKRGMHCSNRHRKIQDFFEINPDMANRYDELIEIKNNILKI